MKSRKYTGLTLFALSAIFVFLYTKYQPASHFTEPFKLNLVHNSSEEADFPLAFGFSVYRDAVQFSQLLDLVYRPYNLYCIHVDIKSEQELHILVKNLTENYANIIVPERFINVQHSKFSVLDSELLCMEALYRRSTVKWKYFINLTGQELPLKTNLEIVRILKLLRGANLMEKTRVNNDRVPQSVGPAPHRIELWKGAVHIVATRDFVDFALHDPRAKDLLEYLKKTLVPDETFFSTLNHEHNLRTPGGYKGDLTSHSSLYPYLNRHKIWIKEGVCHGEFIRGICIFSMDDVPPMIDQSNKKLFANKFVVGVNDDVADFMRQWFKGRARIVYSDPSKNLFTDLTYYSNLSVVQNHF